MILGGGASRDRTDDLFHAMEALSQLSYSPVRKTLFPKGILPPLAYFEARSHRYRGRREYQKSATWKAIALAHYSRVSSAAASLSATVRVCTRIRLALKGFIINRYR